MPRKSPIHYIYPSAISVTPNANDSENDLAVTVIGGAKIKVYSPKSGISMSGGVYQEWSFTGRNRRLSQSGSPYTIYARLAKSDKSKGYLVFAPKDERDGKWYDKYCYVTPDGIFPQLSASHPEGCRVIDNVNWWIRLGDVSLPEEGKRTVTFDTGILGTEEFNTEWAINPDSMPMRIEIGCVIDDEDAGPTPYVYWDKMLNLTATLVEGWTGTDIERFDHWEISRNTGDAAADAAWPSAERASLFAHTGRMTLSHERGALDDFNSAVATTFTVTAWGRPDDSQDPDAALVPMKEASIVILAETVEKYEVVLSSSVVSYNPSSDTYRPEDGIAVNVRATDQRSNVYRLGCGQINAARLVARYAHADTDVWSRLQFTDSPEGVAEAVIPVAAFAAQKNVNVRLENADGKELDSRVVSFLRDGEDSREREWIFFRSKDPVVFGDASSEHPLPSLISGGEVEPDGAASGEDTNKNQDGWVPQGWWDEQHGTDDEYRYEYSSYRDYVRSGESEGEGGHWGDFTKPNTWSYYGEDAVSYRCKWLLDGVEVWQLVSSYTGAFRGTLPLVATLMKRKGSGSEEPVTATDTVITVIFEGLDASYTEAASSPQFTINEVDHPEMVSYLNDARLTDILIVFETREETFSYSIPVIKEADEDSIIQTMEEHGSELFLSKTSDDTANGFITFAKGFLSLVDVVVRGAITAAEGIMNTVRSSNYTGDGIADTGFRLTSDDGTGSSALTVDNLHVRKKATFEELEVKKETAIAGNQVYSSAANIIVKTDFINESGEVVGYIYRQVPWLLKKMPFLLKGVFFGRNRKTKRTITSEELKDIKAFRLYFLAEDDDREIDNMWAVGDLARCQTINLNSSKRNTYVEGSSKPGNVYWWRKVIRVSSNTEEPSENPDTTHCQRALIDGKVYHWFDVSNVDGGYDEGSDIPAAGDHVVQFGNDRTPNRQNIITLDVSNADSPALKFYHDINDFSLANKRIIGLLYNPDTGVPIIEDYGDAFIGARDNSTYIKYDSLNKLLEVKARISAQSTIGNQLIDTYINKLITDITDDIQTQVDKKAETWYQQANPEPNWYNPYATPPLDERSEHVGDLWYCTEDNAGTAYKKYTTWYYEKNGNTYSWKQQNIPQSVFDTIDGKADIFVSKPSTYNVNDMWIISANDTNLPTGCVAGDIVVSSNTRTNNYQASDWSKKDRYTDDSALDTFKANQYVKALTDGAISQSITNAANAASDADSKARAAQAAAEAAASDASTAQSAAEAAQEDANTANNRLSDWASDSKISPQEKTALKQQEDDIIQEYSQICSNADKYEISKDEFQSAYTSAIAAFNKYTASTPENITVESDYANIASYYSARTTIMNAIAEAAKKVADDAQGRAEEAYELAKGAKGKVDILDTVKEALNGATLIDGGLLLTSLIALRHYKGTGDKKDVENYNTYGGMNGIYLNDSTIAAWFGGSMEDRYNSSTQTYDTTNSGKATSLFRMDGSGYLARGNFNWDNAGNVNVKNGYFEGKVTSTAEGKGRWEIAPSAYHTATTSIAIPTITGYDKDGRSKIKILFDGDSGDGIDISYGGGLFFVKQESGIDKVDGGYFRNYWRTQSSENSSFIDAFYNSFYPIIESQYPKDNNTRYTLRVGSDDSGACLYSNNWPTVTATEGRVYKDAWGRLKVYEYENNTVDRINVKTSDFILPDNPPIGTIYLLKGKNPSNSMVVRTRSKPILQGSSNDILVPANSSFDFGGVGVMLFYIGDCWAMIYSN